MWRGLSLRCKIAVFVAVFFLCVAGYCFFFRFRNQAYFRSHVRFDCVTAIRVDFSAPGTYSASVISKPRYIENAYLVLDLPKRVLSETNPEALLSGLEGSFEIMDEDGKQIIWDSIPRDANNLKSHLSENFISLTKIGSCYEFVKWQMNITITKGARRLKGIPHRLVMFDRDSNLNISEDICTLFGLASLILAVIILIVVTAVSRRKRKLIEGNPKVSGTTISSPQVSEEQA